MMDLLTTERQKAAVPPPAPPRSQSRHDISITLDTGLTVSQLDLSAASLEAVDSPDSPLAHPSAVSAGALPRSILREQRAAGCTKQLSFDVPPSPCPSQKSSCVSISGSFHLFEHPRRRGMGRSPPRDPGRFRLANLQQRSNSESMFQAGRSELLATEGVGANGRRCSMAYLPSREQALLRRILGPQGLSWIGKDGDQPSRKSISIALSNDLEGQKCDDSETPLMCENELQNGGRMIYRAMLTEKRRVLCDRALFFSTVAILLMIFETELRSSAYFSLSSLPSVSLKCLILFFTLCLVYCVIHFQVIEVKLFMNANGADDWRVALTPRRLGQIIVEFVVCAICPVPFELWFTDEKDEHFFYGLNVMLSIGMFFRLYWLCRVMLLHSRLFTDASSRSIAGLNRVNFNARFILKTLMTLCPGTVLMIFTSALWILAGWILRLCEREYIPSNDLKREMHGNYLNSMWLIAITFLSVGYGDIVPHTYCGRTMAVITGILGTCTSSMVVAVIARKLELTRAEKHVHNFMMDTRLTKKLKHSAANVLRETWLIYKFRRLVDKPDASKIRLHQRKFLVAIYEMRKVKRDQRKLAENFVSLGDVAKTTSNTYELIHDVHSTQEGLSMRITAMEHQLADISRELGSLTELLRASHTRKNSRSSEASAAAETVRRRREAPI